MKEATAFLEWLTYIDNTIDGQSKRKAYLCMRANDLHNRRELFMKGIDYSYYYHIITNKRNRN